MCETGPFENSALETEIKKDPFLEEKGINRLTHRSSILTTVTVYYFKDFILVFGMQHCYNGNIWLIAESPVLSNPCIARAEIFKGNPMKEEKCVDNKYH